MKGELKNKYAVDINNIEVGGLYYYFCHSKFYQILIGEGLNLGNMYVDLGGEKRIRLHVSELWSKVPDGWTGSVVSFQ